MRRRAIALVVAADFPIVAASAETKTNKDANSSANDRSTSAAVRPDKKKDQATKLPSAEKSVIQDDPLTSSVAPTLRRGESSSMSQAGTRLAAPPTQDNDQKLGPIALQDFKIGVTFYGSFSHYTDTGFAPAFQDAPTLQLGPGNAGLNVFEVTRAYINLFYTPNSHVAIRITPDIYREIDSTDGAIAAGNGAQINGTDNGNYSFRLKYAYVDFQNIFGEGALRDDKVTFGQTQSPLIDWEEGLS